MTTDDGFAGLLPACLHCDGDGPCDCCNSLGRIDITDVAHEFLVSWRNHEGIEAEFVRRGDVAWVRDCTGAILPGNEQDIADGCEVLQMVISIAQAAE